MSSGIAAKVFASFIICCDLTIFYFCLASHYGFLASLAVHGLQFSTWCCQRRCISLSLSIFLSNDSAIQF